MGKKVLIITGSPRQKGNTKRFFAADLLAGCSSRE